jgi:ketosteroid isomerase-like protein
MDARPAIDTMDGLQRLLIVEACRDTVLRAAAAADANDVAALVLLFTADAVLQRPNAEPVRGREAIRESYARRPPERLTRHLVTQTLVDIDSADQARASSSVLLWSGNGKDDSGPYGRPADARQVIGEFHDLMLRTADGWRIQQRRASFILFLGA